MYLLGTQMDYVSEKFESGFTFSNPNEKGNAAAEVHLMSNNLPSIAKLAAKHGIAPLKNWVRIYIR